MRRLSWGCKLLRFNMFPFFMFHARVFIIINHESLKSDTISEEKESFEEGV